MPQYGHEEFFRMLAGMSPMGALQYLQQHPDITGELMHPGDERSALQYAYNYNAPQVANLLHERSAVSSIKKGLHPQIEYFPYQAGADEPPPYLRGMLEQMAQEPNRQYVPLRPKRDRTADILKNFNPELFHPEIYREDDV